MASHTVDELRDAAQVIADAARELGLDLAKMGMHAAEASTDADEREGLREDREPSVPAFVQATSPMTPSAQAPPTTVLFDGERDIAVHRAA